MGASLLALAKSIYYLKFCTLSEPRLKDTKISDTVNMIRNSKNSPGTPFW